MKHLFIGGPSDGEVRYVPSTLGVYCVASCKLTPPFAPGASIENVGVKHSDYYPQDLWENGTRHTVYVHNNQQIISKLIEGYLPTELNLPGHVKEFVNYAAQKELYINKFNSALADLNIPILDPTTTKYKLLLAVYLKGIQST